MDLDELARDFQAHNAEVKTRLDAANASIDLLRKGDPSGKMGLDGITAILHEVQQKMARRPVDGGMPAEVKTLGSRVIESAEYKTFAAAGCKGPCRIELKNVTNLGSATAGEGGVGGLVAPDRQAPVAMPMRRFTVRSLLQPGTTESNLIQVPVQTQRNLNAAVVLEGQLKPQSDMTYTLTDFPVATIAHYAKASRQNPCRRAGPAGYDRHRPPLRAPVRRGPASCSSATALGGNLNGAMVPQASAFAEAFTPTDETAIDRLRLAALQTRLALYPPTGLHPPTRWTGLESSSPRTAKAATSSETPRLAVSRRCGACR